MTECEEPKSMIRASEVVINPLEEVLERIPAHIIEEQINQEINRIFESTKK